MPAMEIRADDHLRGLAFHEAGHAVVAWSLNLRVETIYIREIGEGGSGTKTDPPDHLPLMDQLTTLAAGVEAEREFKSPLPEGASDRDRLTAINLIRAHYVGLASNEVQLHLAASHARARELLVEHRERVIRVAERLRDVRQVHAAEFTRLMTAY
jgi:ATP-dependent Zn protease